LQSLKKVLKKTLISTGITENLKANKAHSIWKEVVGERINNNVKTTMIKKGILYLEAKTPVWRSEITLIKYEIITKLNKKLNNNIIKDLKVK